MRGNGCGLLCRRLLGGGWGTPQAAVAAGSFLLMWHSPRRVQEGMGEELGEGDALHGVAPQQLHPFGKRQQGSVQGHAVKRWVAEDGRLVKSC